MITITYMQRREKIFCDYGFTETHEQNDITGTDVLDKECNFPVHSELIERLEALKPHIAVLLGQEDILLLPDSKELEKIEALAVNFHGEEEVEIQVRVILPIGYPVKFWLPKISYALDKPNYPFMQKLKNAVLKLNDAVLNYHNGKLGDGAQLDMFREKEKEKSNKPEVSTSTVGRDGSIEGIPPGTKNKGKAGRAGKGKHKGADGEDDFTEPGI